MAKYPFLSDEWVAEARAIYAEAGGAGALAGTLPPTSVRVNLVVTNVPFGEGALNAHVDTSLGRVAIDTGHVPAPDVTVSLDYVTAKSLFISGDVQAALAAFLSGRIKVDGDLTKLLDPTAGIWPGRPFPGSGPAGIGQGASAAPGALASGQPEPPRQEPLGNAPPVLVDVAARLQEITE
ncbi:MAG TPA: hypothetical protein VME20_08045 [Acidimicrobiales bacterium]|nr:hypothetical protein [Acidimicrobiales bacterium]